MMLERAIAGALCETVEKPLEPSLRIRARLLGEF